MVYKTGIKDLYFRVEVDNRSASVFIEMAQRDLVVQQLLYERFEMFRNILQTYLKEDWVWIQEKYDEQGKIISIIEVKMENVSVFRETDWIMIFFVFKASIIGFRQVLGG